MMKMKKAIFMVIALAIVLTMIPAIPAQAETVTIKKTAKEKYIIEKFDDQDDIDWMYEDYYEEDPDYIPAIEVINECGGWYNLTEKHDYIYDDDTCHYVQDTDGQEGTYLNLHSFGGGMTKAQAAMSLKNMYGKYSCIKKADLRNTDNVTEKWLVKRLIRIAGKRQDFECAQYLENRNPTNELLCKYTYAYIVADGIIKKYPGMDPRVEHVYEIVDEDAGD